MSATAPGKFDFTNYNCAFEDRQLNEYPTCLRATVQRIGMPSDAYLNGSIAFSPDMQDLIKKILLWDPILRLTPEKALKHQLFMPK